jgi:MoxR-like ATPase
VWPLERVSQACDRLVHHVEQVIHGKSEVVEFALLCLLAEGHLLIEDVPGVAKTSLAKALAQAAGGSMQRIQFTPDLLPADITGVRVYDPARREFEFRPGPVFANVVICDEINRASPKTQSALLEVMAERQVSIDGERHRPEWPFLVVATQNPLGFAGTYPLPESQIDRFLMSLSVGYPSAADESVVIDDAVHRRTPDLVRPALAPADVRAMIEAVRRVYVGPEARQYVVSITAPTRGPAWSDRLRLGLSPRASNALALAAQARAARQGRDHVRPDDVKAVAVPVLRHRLLLTPEARLRGNTPERVVGELLGATVPSQPVGA